MRKYKRQIEQAKEKAANRERLSLEAQLPMSELIAGVRQTLRVCRRAGPDHHSTGHGRGDRPEVGPWGQQKSHRHGHQPGYVIYAGAKFTLERPRFAQPGDQEVPWPVTKPFKRTASCSKRWRGS